MASVEIMRRDCSVSQRAEAARTVDAKQARRILAIAMVLDGHARLLAAQACGMDRQTLRDWVIRYNEDGVAGLDARPLYRTGNGPRWRSGFKAALTARQTG
jgi:Winged helix-turn helix